MSRAAWSCAVFGVYAFAMGVGLVLAPNLLLGLFRFAPTDEPWASVAGAIALAIGVYYLVCARNEVEPFMRASIYGRTMFCCVTCALAWRYQTPMLVVFGVVDLLGALWTAWALGRDARSRSGP